MKSIRGFWSFLRGRLSRSSPHRARRNRQTSVIARCAAVEPLEPRQLMSVNVVSAPNATGTAAAVVAAQIFYIDPIYGSSNGDGSKAHPWHTLEEVVAAGLINGQDRSKGVVHAGDTMYLLTGNHGSVSLTSSTGQFKNTSLIGVLAYPGAHPVLNQLIVDDSSNWGFKGLTIQNPPTISKYYTLVSFSNAKYIVFDRNTVYSQADVSGWLPAQWDTSAAYYGVRVDAYLSTITNNSIQNVRFGIAANGDKLTISGNKIDGFADDAIDFTSSNTVIQHNTIANHYGKLQDGNHNDGIQGWTIAGVVTNNITIDGNIMLISNGKYVDIPAVPTGVGQDSMQGISIFDGVWNNVTVTNNIVSVAAYHGISMYGVSKLVIANNTVIDNNSNISVTSWIGVFPSKTGVQPKDVIVRNNISSRFSISATGVIDDHNISLTLQNYWSKSATDTFVLNPKTLFVKYDPALGQFDFRLAANSPAYGKGSASSAPKYNVLGVLRNTLKENIGAY